MFAKNVGLEFVSAGREKWVCDPPWLQAWKRIFKKRSKKKAKNKQIQAHEGKDQVKSKSKVIRMKKIQLEGLKLPSLKLNTKITRQGSKLPTG
ncbi:hypothetical protein Tco_1494771 [Tanacetum coccineum]